MAPLQSHTACAEAENGDLSKQYEKFVRMIAEHIPTFAPLDLFLKPDGQHHNLECEITSIQFEDGKPLGKEGPITLKKSGVDSVSNIATLEKWLEGDCQQMLLIENLTPCVLNMLGGTWKVSPEFFLSHLENSDWYKEQNIAEHLPSLRSARQSHIRFQFVAPREYIINGTSNAQESRKRPRK